MNEGNQRDEWRRLFSGEVTLSRGGRPRKTGRAAGPVSTVTLAQLGTTKQQLHRWRALGRIPDAEFEEIVRAFKASGQRLTAGGVLRTWNQGTGRRRPASLERMAEELRKAGWTVSPPADD